MVIRVNGQHVQGFAEELPKGAADKLKDHPPLGKHHPEYYGLRLDDKDVVLMAKDLPSLSWSDMVTIDGKKAKVVFDIQNPINDPPKKSIGQAIKEKAQGLLMLLFNPPIADPPEVFEKPSNGPA